MWQFGGHHLAINTTIVGADITLSPSLTGGQPVDFTFEGVQVRQLAGDEDKSFALINALNVEQRKKAILDDHHDDLKYGPGKDDRKLTPEGITGDELTPQQQEMLLDLIRERVGILNDIHSAKAMSRIKDDLGKTTFAWFGPTETGSASSFRIQGPRIIIEYAPQHLGGSATEHTHAMYRDPANDYGRSWLRK
jgi:hypothetical protein